MTENPYRDVSVMDGFMKDAWNEGHAAGKVEGYNQAIEDVLRDLESVQVNVPIHAGVRALRKKVSE